MHFDTHEITFDTGLSAGERWSHIMLNSHGLRCAFDPRQSIDSTVRSWRLGEVGVSLADLATQTLSPVGEELPSWQGGWLFVKLVTQGHVHVQSRAIRVPISKLQDGQARHFASDLKACLAAI